jgi:hypothetical protein
MAISAVTLGPASLQSKRMAAVGKVAASEGVCIEVLYICDIVQYLEELVMDVSLISIVHDLVVGPLETSIHVRGSPQGCGVSNRYSKAVTAILA